MLGHPALPTRFWAKVRPAASGCWEWTGATNSRGYGCFGVDGASQLAHRHLYSVLVGTIPEGLTIDHLCRNKVCANPAHLEPTTRRENSFRAYEQDRPSHCPRGHAYTPANTITKHRSNGGINRMCRGCTEARRAEKNRRAREAAFARGVSPR